MNPKFGFCQFEKTLLFTFSLAAGYPVSPAHASPIYYDTSSASGLTAGTATWDAGTTGAWQGSSSPGTTAPGLWISGDTAVFKTGGTNTVTVSGTVVAEGLVQENNSTATTIGGSGIIELGASGILNNTGNRTFTVNAPITLTATATFNPNDTTRAVTVGGVVSGAFGLTKAGSGTLNLNAANDYTGVTSIGAGTLKLGIDNAIPSGSSLNWTASSTLELNGKNVTVKGIGMTGGSSNIILNTPGTALTFTIDTPALTSFTFTQQINAPGVKLVKNGAGTQTLGRITGSNTYSGGTEINAGILAVTRGLPNLGGSGENVLLNANGTLAFTANTNLQTEVVNRVDDSSTGTLALGLSINTALDFTGKDNLYLGSTGDFTYNPSSFTAGANGYRLGGGGGTLTIATTNLLTGSRSLAVRGNVTLSNSQNYTGATTVSSGTLLINGSLGITTTTVNAGTLGGTGTIGGAVTIDSGAFLSPGASIESLGVASADINGSLVIEYDGTGAGTIDLLAVTGLLDIAGSTVDFNLFGTALDDPYYIFATYGSLTGTFGTVTDLPTGYGIQYAHLGNNIALVAIPETNVAALIGGFGVIALLRRKKSREVKAKSGE